MTSTLPATRPYETASHRRTSPSRVTLQTYDSLVDLRRQLDDLDGAVEGGAVVLVLDPHFAGHQPSLVRRRRPAPQLTLAAVGGELPTLADWPAIDADALGWRRIDVEPSWRTAVDAAAHSTDDADVVVYWPAWRSR